MKLRYSSLSDDSELRHIATMSSLVANTPPSPSGSAGSEYSLSYYKTQYEQLEAELADFQSSSRELEAELERDIEASEKRERHLQEKVENLGFEVEEWKVCYFSEFSSKLAFNPCSSDAVGVEC